MTTIQDTTKVPKAEAGDRVAELNGLDGVEAERRATDEFDVPPTAVIEVRVDLGALAGR